MEKIVDVVIPVYRPDKKLYKLLDKLADQSVKPDKVIIMNTETGRAEDSSENLAAEVENFFARKVTLKKGELLNITIKPVMKSEFDHGGTRDAAFMSSGAPYVLFLTQDAVPSDPYLIEEMLQMFMAEDVGVVYGRQLANRSSGIVEGYTRLYNYPSVSAVHSKADIKKLGVKAFYCSDVCAMYRRDVYIANGGFVKKTIFNEDMIFAGNYILKGGKVGYCADAKVYHSHKYTCKAQFKRNFDLGVSQADHPEVFKSVSSTGEGLKYVWKITRYLGDQHYFYLMPGFYAQCLARYLGYKLGTVYKSLPKSLVLLFTSNKNYWDGVL
ncbi:MAG: glycosyltransferase [Lachnospiraceae bacterium]|nr:glycosyltransferase [Lachnospiraceae bacterium]